MKSFVNFGAIRVEFLRQRTNNNLSWRDEERPFSSEMLDHDCHESFDGTKDGSVDDDGSRISVFNFMLFPFVIFRIPFVLFETLESLSSNKRFVIFMMFDKGNFASTLTLICGVLQVESNWELEIKLNCSALMRSVQRIENFDINLWSVESSITRVEFPWLSEGVECVLKTLFS